jgi:hypothetical protein
MALAGALPVWQQILLDLFVPPIGAVVWWLCSRGWALTIQGSAVSEQTRKREKRGAIILLAIAYLLMFGITIYAWLN